MRLAVSAVLLAFVVLEVRTQDPSICDFNAYPATYSGSPALPVLGDQATLRIEMNADNATRESHLFLDTTNNHAALHSWKDGTHSYTILKFDVDEVAQITWPADQQAIGATCKIQKLSTSMFSNIIETNTVNGQPTAPKLLRFLRMDPSVNDTRIRFSKKAQMSNGVWVNVWEGCMWKPDKKYQSHNMYYFADKDVWYSTMGPLSTPMAIQSTGTMPDPLNPGSMKSFNSRISFADYRPNLAKGETDSFKVPDGVFCARDNTSMSMPAMPTHFSLRSEIIDYTKKSVNWISEYYEQALNLTRYDYLNQDLSLYGNRQLVRVHDFNTGIAYIMDPEIKNCTIQPIQKAGYDDKDVGQGVRIRSPSEFFDLGKYHYVYVGQRQERGIACDVWVTQRTDWPPPGPSYTTTWEYYFSAGVQEEVGTQQVYSVPIKLKITAANPSINVQYNWYEFNTDHSSFHNYDIGQCFNGSYRADYLIVVPGNYRGLVWASPVIFKRLVIISISAQALVSPLRVSNVQTSFNATGLLISFSLLDKAGITGDVANPAIQPKLDTAIASLNTALNFRNFTILVQDPFISGGFQNLRVDSYSYTRGEPFGRSARSARHRRDASRPTVTKVHFQNSPDTGMTTGSMAGLGIGLLIAGLLVGILIALVVLKMKEGGAGGVLSFSNPSAQ